MCGVNSLERHAVQHPHAARHGETVMPCPFCGSGKATGVEIDLGMWAVCCNWCGSIGPRSKSIQLAVARWNAPIPRPDSPPAPGQGQVNR